MITLWQQKRGSLSHEAGNDVLTLPAAPQHWSLGTCKSRRQLDATSPMLRCCHCFKNRKYRWGGCGEIGATTCCRSMEESRVRTQIPAYVADWCWQRSKGNFVGKEQVFEIHGMGEKKWIPKSKKAKTITKTKPFSPYLIWHTKH